MCRTTLLARVSLALAGLALASLASAADDTSASPGAVRTRLAARPVAPATAPVGVKTLPATELDQLIAQGHFTVAQEARIRAQVDSGGLTVEGLRTVMPKRLRQLDRMQTNPMEFVLQGGQMTPEARAHFRAVGASQAAAGSQNVVQSAGSGTPGAQGLLGGPVHIPDDPGSSDPLVPMGGDCCTDNGDPGCSDPVCESAVCGSDPFCCTSTWDDVCAAEAVSLCGCAGTTNDDCPNAIPLTVGDVVRGSTATATCDGNALACGLYVFAPGVWYTVTGTGNEITATTCGSDPDTSYDTIIQVYCGSCTSLSCVGANDDAGCGFLGFLSSSVTWCSAPGVQYMIFVNGFFGQGEFQLAVVDGPPCSTPPSCTVAPCSVTCPPGSATEVEPNCGLPNDTVNGGCNSFPEVYSTIACGQTVCGTGAYDSCIFFRDTDWWQFTLTEVSFATLTVETEFAGSVFIVNNDCANIQLLGQGNTEPCVPSSVTATCALSPGTYIAFVAPNFGDPVACGAAYTLRLDCVPACSDCSPCDVFALLQPLMPRGRQAVDPDHPCYGHPMPTNPKPACCATIRDLLDILPGAVPGDHPRVPPGHPCWEP